MDIIEYRDQDRYYINFYRNIEYFMLLIQRNNVNKFLELLNTLLSNYLKPIFMGEYGFQFEINENKLNISYIDNNNNKLDIENDQYEIDDIFKIEG
jgi:hypothetical protein